MKKLLQALSYHKDIIDQMETMGMGSLPLGIRSERTILKNKIKLLKVMIKKNPDIIVMPDDLDDLFNFNFNRIYNTIEAYRGFYDLKGITDKCQKYLKENNIKRNTFLDILSYYFYDINWDISSKKYGLIKSDSVTLDNLLQIQHGSILEVYSHCQKEFIDIPLFLMHYKFNEKRPVQINSLKELNNIKNEIVIINRENLNQEEIDQSILLSKKNNNTLFLFGVLNQKIGEVTVKKKKIEIESDFKLYLNPVYLFDENINSKVTQLLKIKNMKSNNRIESIEIPYSLNKIQFSKELLFLSESISKQIKSSSNGYMYLGNKKIIVNNKKDEKYFIKKGDILAQKECEVSDIIERNTMLQKQLRKQISLDFEKIIRDHYKVINCRKTHEHRFYHLTNYKEIFNKDDSTLLLKYILKNNRSGIDKLKEKYFKKGKNKRLSNSLISNLWSEILKLGEDRERFYDKIPY